MKRILAALLSLAVVASATPAHAQTYPSKVIRFIVNFPAGGPLDVLARLIAEKTSTALKQPVIVENRPGAAGNIGADAVAKAAPDGYTVLLTTDSVFTLNPLIYPKMSFDAGKDLKPVALTGAYVQALVVNPKVEAKQLVDFVALSKKQRLTYSSAGSGSPGQLAFEYFLNRTGAKVDHVPYKGNAPAVTALIAGEVDAGFLALPGAVQNVKSGKLRALAVSGPTRSPALPDVPTVAESGYPGFDVRGVWYMMVPAATPDAITKVLYEQTIQAMQAPDVREKLAAMSIEPVVGDAKEAAERIKIDRAKWAPIVKAAKIQVD